MILKYILDYYGHVVGTYIQADMRRELFDKLEKLPFSFYDNNETGKIIKVRSQRAQDIGAGDGVVLVAIWSGGTSYVDVYRTSDLKYIGGYEVPFGEIESVTSVDKHLVFLMHNTYFNGTRAGKILMTKERLPIS